MLFWCLLSRGQDYAHQQPSLTAKKLRRAEITAGAPTLKGKQTGVFATRERMRHAERELAQQAEASYTRMVSRLASRPAAQDQARRAERGGRERDSGARTKALEGQRRAADHEPLTSALRHVLDSRPPAA